MGKVVDAVGEAGAPDKVGRDGVGEGVAGEVEEAGGFFRAHLEGGGHGKDGVLGGVAVGVGDDFRVGGAAQARSGIEGDGIAGIHFANALEDPLGKSAGVGVEEVGFERGTETEPFRGRAGGNGITDVGFRGIFAGSLGFEPAAVGFFLAALFLEESAAERLDG